MLQQLSNMGSRKRAPTADEAAAQLRRHETELVNLQRIARRTRSELIAAKASGDTAAEAQSLQESSAVAKKIDEVTVAIDVTKGTIEVLVARERETNRLECSDTIRKASGAFKDKVFALADAQKAFAAALMAVRLEQDALDAVMVRSGVTPDPYEFRAKFIPTLQVSLSLETQGVLGEKRTLDTSMQLEQSGRANLKRVAAEYHELIMRRVRNAFSTNPPPKAA
jgi:hypothetical protein